MPEPKPRVECSECGQTFALRKDGTVRAHGRLGGVLGECPGSWHLPRSNRSDEGGGMMPEPEIWVRWPTEEPGGEVERLLRLALNDAGLVRVPDGAIERLVAREEKAMRALKTQYGHSFLPADLEGWRADSRLRWGLTLRVALGEDT